MRRAACVCALVVIAACRGGAAPVDEHAWPEPPKDAIVKPTESGPVKATVAVWPPKPTLGDPLYVRLTVEAQRGVVVDVPFAERGPPHLVKGGALHRREPEPVSSAPE